MDLSGQSPMGIRLIEKIISALGVAELDRQLEKGSQ